MICVEFNKKIKSLSFTKLSFLITEKLINPAKNTLEKILSDNGTGVFMCVSACVCVCM